MGKGKKRKLSMNCPKCSYEIDAGEFDFEVEELGAWHYKDDFFLDVLNGKTSVEEARDNLSSFRNSEFFRGTQEKYKKL